MDNESFRPDWTRFRIEGPFPSERAGHVVYRIRDTMSGDWERDAAGEIMSFSPLAGAIETRDAMNREAERKARATLLSLGGSLWRW